LQGRQRHTKINCRQHSTAARLQRCHITLTPDLAAEHAVLVLLPNLLLDGRGETAHARSGKIRRLLAQRRVLLLQAELLPRRRVLFRRRRLQLPQR
jgi:hypothetical protein